MDKTIEEALFAEKISNKEYYVAGIDANDCRSKKSFLRAIGIAFQFPSYFGQNLDALRDCLNDLEWLDKPNYILFIKNSKEFLSQEPEEVRDKILILLEEVPKEWANVPNYEGEDLYRKKADFRVRLL
jgi:RNAse (barnase) inhibitor barstar